MFQLTLPLHRPAAAILSILLCQTPENFTRQCGTPDVNGLIHYTNPVWLIDAGIADLHHDDS